MSATNNTTARSEASVCSEPSRRRMKRTMRFREAWFIAAIAALNGAATAPAAAETIATFTRNQSNPTLRGVRIGGEIAANALGARIAHYIPRSEAPPEQLGLIDEVIRNKPDAVVLAPYDPRAMVAAAA